MEPSYALHNFLSLLLFLQIVDSSPAAAGKIPAFIVFGDSTVDAGNNNRIQTLLKSNFPPYGRDFIGGEATGRFCNGRLATDFIGDAIGLGPIVPAYLDASYGINEFSTSVCFASAGTGLDNATAGVLNAIPLWKEIEYYKEYQQKLMAHMGKMKAKETISEALYLISIGTNDFLENYFALVTGRFQEFTVGEFEDFLVSLASDFITEIYRLGARKIICVGLAPIGCLPLERATNVLQGGECVEELNEVARRYNGKMENMVKGLGAKLIGIKMQYIDVYDTVTQIFDDPSSYGFENVMEGCCGTGKYEMSFMCNELNPFTCGDPDKYAFWDAFHPSERLNRLMANFTLSKYIYPCFL